jgi:translation initiation factor IF-3
LTKPSPLCYTPAVRAGSWSPFGTGERVAFCVYAWAEVIGNIEREVRVNERIRAREVRLIDENGAQLGVMPTPEALRVARGKNLDLIEVAPNAQPPVCRIMDYGKHKYEQAKRERETRKKGKASEVRLLRMKPQISQHDLDVKVRKLRELLADGSKVRVSIRFRGREMSKPELATELFSRIGRELADVAQVEGSPRREGRTMDMMLAPKPGARPPREKKEKPEKAEAGQEAPSPESPAQAPEPAQKATADVEKQVGQEPVVERPLKSQDAEDSGETG